MGVYIGFSTRKFNPLFMLIRKITGAKCSHAWLLVEEEFFGIPMVMEATEWGVRIIDAKLFWERNQIVAVVKPKVDLTDATRKHGSVLGELYDFTGLLGAGIVAIAYRWLKRKVRNPIASPHALFCSEMVMQVMKKSSYPGTEDMVPSETSPNDELTFLESTGHSVTWTPPTPESALT